MCVMKHVTYYSVGNTRSSWLASAVVGSHEEIPDRAKTRSETETTLSYLDMKVFSHRSVGASELKRRHIKGPSEHHYSSLVSPNEPEFLSTNVVGQNGFYLYTLHGAFSPTN